LERIFNYKNNKLFSLRKEKLFTPLLQLDAVARTYLREEEKLRQVVLAEMQREASRLAALSMWLARRAFRAGVTMRVFTDVYWVGESVHLTVTFQLMESKLDARKTRMWMDTRLNVFKRLLAFINQKLEEKGIRCDVDFNYSRRAKGTKGAVPETLTLEVTFVPVRVDVDRLFRTPTVRRLVVNETYTSVDNVATSFLKALETDVAVEYERGAGNTDLEEAGGYAEGGGGEEGLHSAGAGGLGAGGYAEGVEGGGAGEGWIRLIDAVQMFGVPLLLVDSLIRQGRMEAKKLPGPDGILVTWVKVEDVKKLKEVLAGKGEVKGGGG
jgi:hypothetical protein